MTWTVIDMTYYKPADPIERSIVILRNGSYYILNDEPSVSRWTVTGKTPLGIRVEIPLSNVDAIETYTQNRLEEFRDRLNKLETTLLASHRKALTETR